MSSLSKYYNKMNFPVKFRKIWELNSPAVELPPGGEIVGPSEVLSHYSFLAPMMYQDFYKVSSITSDYEDKPEIVYLTKGEERKEEVKEEIKEDNKLNYSESSTPTVKKLDNVKDKKLPFDVKKKINWVALNIETLEVAAKELEIDMSFTNNLKKSQKRWALISIIKESIKVNFS